jgi:foldase protein PrsA
VRNALRAIFAIGAVVAAFSVRNDGVSAMTYACSERSATDIASVDGRPVTCSEYYARLLLLPVAKSTLDQVIQSILIDQYAYVKHITISDAAVSKREGEIKARYPSGQFDTILKQQNLTDADVRRILRQQLILDRVVGPNKAGTAAFLQRLRANANVMIFDERLRGTANPAQPVRNCSSSPGGDLASVNGQRITCRAVLSRLALSPQGVGVFLDIVQSMLVEQYARANHITILDADVTLQEAEIKARYQPGQFEQILKGQNLTEEGARKILRQKLIISKAVAPNVKVTQSDIEAYLVKNHKTLDTPERVRVRHILVGSLEVANAVATQLKNGASFEALARQYSTDPGSRDKGGELGFFSRGQMVPEFNDAAFSQEIGVVGPPVKSPFGYHIIEVEEKLPSKVATLEDSQDAISKILRQEQEARLIPAFLDRLRVKARIRVFDVSLKRAVQQPLHLAN